MTSLIGDKTLLLWRRRSLCLCRWPCVIPSNHKISIKKKLLKKKKNLHVNGLEIMKEKKNVKFDIDKKCSNLVVRRRRKKEEEGGREVKRKKFLRFLNNGNPFTSLTFIFFSYLFFYFYLFLFFFYLSSFKSFTLKKKTTKNKKQKTNEWMAICTYIFLYLYLYLPTYLFT